MQKRLIDWEKLAGKVGFNSYELGARCLTQEPVFIGGLVKNGWTQAWTICPA
jgi:hypothetical protein